MKAKMSKNNHVHSFSAAATAAAATAAAATAAAAATTQIVYIKK